MAAWFNKAVVEAVITKIDEAPGALTDGDLALLQAFAGKDLVTRAVAAREKARQPPAPPVPRPRPSPEAAADMPMTLTPNLFADVLVTTLAKAVTPLRDRVAALEAENLALRARVAAVEMCAAAITPPRTEELSPDVRH